MKFGGTVVYVDDVPAALDFYRRAFGFETRFFDETYGYGELETGGPPVAFASHQLGDMLMPGGDARPESGHCASGVEIAFVTTDVPAAFTKAVGAGAVAVAEPKAMPWGATVAYVRSAEGTLIGLSTPVGG
jgi:lactoylglutathione lyase